MLPTNQCWLLIQPQLPQPRPLFITCCFRAEAHGIHTVMLDNVGGHPRLWCAHHAQAVETLVVLRPWEHLVHAKSMLAFPKERSCFGFTASVMRQNDLQVFVITHCWQLSQPLLSALGTLLLVLFFSLFFFLFLLFIYFYPKIVPEEVVFHFLGVANRAALWKVLYLYISLCLRNHMGSISEVFPGC